MKRPWERDRSLAHIPLGWRRSAFTMLALAAEHCIRAGVAVRWSDVPHPYCPALVIVEQGGKHGVLPLHRERVQFVGRAIMDRIAVRTLSTCMACGSVAEPPTHFALQASGSRYIALLCDDCQDGAQLDGNGFWCVIGRYDPLMLESEDEGGAFADGEEYTEDVDFGGDTTGEDGWQE